MMNKSVIKKGKFNLPKADNFISLTQFLFIKEDGHKFLLLKLYNDRSEWVTGVTLEVAQTDMRGLPLHKFNIDCPISKTCGKPNSQIVLGSKIALCDNCAGFTVRVLSADYGNYRYTDSGDELLASYKKRTYELAYQNSTGQIGENLNEKSKQGGANFNSNFQQGSANPTVSFKKFKFSAIICILTLLVLAAAIFAIYSITESTVKYSYDFTHLGVRYAFEEYNKSNGSNIMVVGGTGTIDEIVIPEYVKGHKVTKIASGAFQNNNIIKKVTIEAPIIIESYAFANCRKLIEINLEKVTKIGNNAFNRCESLIEIKALNLSIIENYAFYNCNNLINVHISNSQSVLEIGSSALGNCYNLSTVTIDQWLNYGRGSSFLNGSRVNRLELKNYNYEFTLNNIDYGEDVSSPISYFFGYYTNDNNNGMLNELYIENCDFIPQGFCKNLPLNSVTIKNLRQAEVGNNAFENCVNLTTIDVPLKFTSVGERAFYSTAIKQFDGNSLTNIGNSAFAECKQLYKFNLYSNIGLTYIGTEAFFACRNLNEFIIPAAVEQIGNNAFLFCYKLFEVYNLSQLNIELLSYEHGNVGLYALKVYKSLDEKQIAKISQEGYEFWQSDSGKWYLLNYPRNQTSLILPKDVIYNYMLIPSYDIIPYFAIDDFEINEVYIPNTVRQVGEYAFYNCTNIVDVILNDGLLIIGEASFQHCINLTQIFLPSSVTNIGVGAFSSCMGLKKIVLNSDIVIESDAFYNCTSLFDIYNLGGMNLKKGSHENGSIAYYAKEIHTSLNKPSILKTINYSLNDCEIAIKRSNVGLINYA